MDGTSGSLLVHSPAGKAGAVERALRQRIALGQWPVGTQLPAERQLAVEYGVARNTMRRALAALGDAGLLSASAGRGTFVANAVPGAMLDALRRAQRPVAPADAAEVRLLIEPAAAALAAARATTADLQRIDQGLRDTLAADAAAAFELADAALHEAVVAACRNLFLVDLYRVIAAARQEPRWGALKRRAGNAELRATYDRQHADIAHAIRARDAAGAHRAMQTHLRLVQASLSDAQ